MTSVRFIHTADIHLDSPLRGLSGEDSGMIDRIRLATRDAFEQLVNYAIESAVDFIVIAGDLYDGNWRDYNTGLYFVRQMGRLNEAGIPVYLLHGNHDAASQITKRLELPDNVYVFRSTKPETLTIDALNVALHGQSFRQRDVTDNLALSYPAPVADTFNIGVLHTALAGRPGHEPYAPCTPEDLANKGYDYWALGHVHQTEIVHEHPYIVFPGNLQGRHIRETGPKGASLVTVVDGVVSSVETIPFDVVRWAVVAVDMTEADRLGDAFDAIDDAIETAVVNEGDGRLLVCRIRLEGRTDVHDALVASAEQTLAEARAAAVRRGDDSAWVEKVIFATSSIIDPQTLSTREDAIGELQRMLQTAYDDSELLAQIDEDLGALVRRMPHELREEIDDDILTAALEGDYAQLIHDVMPILTARLSVED